MLFFSARGRGDGEVNGRAAMIPTGVVYAFCPWLLALLADSCSYPIVFVTGVW